MTEQKMKAAAEPPLDCLVGLRMAIEDVMWHQFTGSREAMTALQELVNVAEAAGVEIAHWRNVGSAIYAVGLREVQVHNATELTGRGSEASEGHVE